MVFVDGGDVGSGGSDCGHHLHVMTTTTTLRDDFESSFPVDEPLEYSAVDKQNGRLIFLKTMAVRRIGTSSSPLHTQTHTVHTDRSRGGGSDELIEMTLSLDTIYF